MMMINSNNCFRSHKYFILFFVFGLVILATSTEAAELYERVKIDNGQLHIITTTNKDIVPSKRTYKHGKEVLVQVNFEKAAISNDKTTVGWLASYPNCCTSYPIPLELIIFRKGKIIRIFNGNDFPVWQWQFEQNGSRVAFEQETVHGGMGIHYELREITTGHLIDSYEGKPKPNAPKWVCDLKYK
jgi:hypothetical protein